MEIYIITINQEIYRAYAYGYLMWQTYNKLCDTYEQQGYYQTKLETGEKLPSYTICDTNTNFEHPLTGVKVSICTRKVQLLTSTETQI